MSASEPEVDARGLPRGVRLVAPNGPAYVYRALLERVIDGDTYILAIDLGMNAFTKVHIRLYGYSTPEIREPKGREAAEFAASTMSGRALLVRTYKDRQTFARWIADVWVRYGEEWVPLGEAMVLAELATRAEGA